MIKNCSRLVSLLGYLAVFLALVDSIMEYLKRYHHPDIQFNSGFAVGDSALAMVGVMGVTAGYCLKKIEDRVSKIESMQSQNK